MDRPQPPRARSSGMLTPSPMEALRTTAATLCYAVNVAPPREIVDPGADGAAVREPPRRSAQA